MIADRIHHLLEVGIPKLGAADHPVGVPRIPVACVVTEHVQVVGVAGPKNLPPNHARAGHQTVVEGVVELSLIHIYEPTRRH